ncbi:MAG TPA: YjhG/YagF family D-xylonate dehydratase [Ilumatobacteraceae bacterium]|nr:YjhG/YagF family D-xylonate dehydratase [Ilumatobacteraceae bacterium]
MDSDLFDSGDASIYTVTTTTDGPAGSLPLEAERLASMSSGELFGWTQNVAMGLAPKRLTDREFLVLSTLGGLRGPDGSAVALGYHTGHWELGLLVDAAARRLTELGATPFAGHVSDPCDGRSNGTSAMLDSLPYRNDAAIVLRRLARSLPSRAGTLGVATCDKGLPAMMMALAGVPSTPSVVVPGGVTLLAHGAEDTAAVQTLATRFARGEITLDHAATMGCRACGSAGGGCQFMGTAATSQVVAEALGWTLPHSALHPSGSPIWLDMARRSASALVELSRAGTTTADVLTDAAVRNAMAVHAAVGGSTNLYLHLPAIAHAAGLTRPSAADWASVNRRVPRLVDALPNGPKNFATVHVFLAGGVPEVMLQLASSGALELDVPTVSGRTLAANLEWWEGSERRARLRDRLATVEGIDPDEVIRSIAIAPLPGTITILGGNLAPDGALVKSTSIAPSLLDADGVYDITGRARVFVTETDAIDAIKRREIAPGEVMVLVGIGPSFGMPETYQVTAALKYVDDGGRIPLITDGRFSGVSTGPCVGHVSPEAAGGGPIGRVRDGDPIRIRVDTHHLSGTVDLLVPPDVVANRTPAPLIGADLPDDTRLWAALQAASGGAWGGCVYDVDAIIDALGAPAAP